MNLHPCEDLAPLHDSVSRLLAHEASFAQHGQSAAGDVGWNPRLWAHLVELGVAGLCVPEALGGFGRSVADLGDLHRLFGRALLLEPALATAMATYAACAADDAALRQRLLDRLMAGEVVAWAHDEVAVCQADRHDGVWRLRGRIRHVLHGAQAAQLIVTARMSGNAFGLFLIDAHANGVQHRAHRLLDDTPAAELQFDDTEAVLLGQDAAVIRTTLNLGSALVAAELVGAMETAYALTLEHVRTREQFGRPLAANQAVRHRVAEMVVQLESARSMAMLACAAVDHALDDTELLRARLVISRAARTLCHGAVQLHGGIGMSEKHAVGHCLRRVLVADALWGDASTFAAAIAASAEAAHA